MVTNNLNSRDGKFIEKIGFFDPLKLKKSGVQLNIKRLKHWINFGAKVSKRVSYIIKKSISKDINEN
ncbi:hypothetical protein AOE58_00065 [Candidatus Riesia pthiripubis]|uniref:30S ribosomal protein S16 n=1 Tax=Candidatus Riesia pthiripubis TaxID=428412 RepID=A0A1V0HP32_9ENTR|nr:hypothetical protein AOE58_00065 [Candidatus Riesia pthiripubis]